MKKRTAILAGVAAVVVLTAAACTGQPSGPGTPPNTAPVASLTAGPALSGPGPLTVNFDASGSTDSDGTVVQYFWDFGDGHTGNGVTIGHTFAPGTWQVQLQVTDDKGAFNTTSTTIQVTNTAPNADFTITPATGTAPLNATFDASTLSTDPDGTIDSYHWDFEELGTESGPTLSEVNKSIPAGTINVTLTVTDKNGATATKTRSVTATGTPAAPTNLTLTGGGCCDTYADFTWTPVPGADAYEIYMDAISDGWNCLIDASDVISGQTATGRVQDALLCRGSDYNASIRARANGQWGPWSPTVHVQIP